METYEPNKTSEITAYIEDGVLRDFTKNNFIDGKAVSSISIGRNKEGDYSIYHTKIKEDGSKLVTVGQTKFDLAEATARIAQYVAGPDIQKLTLTAPDTDGKMKTKTYEEDKTGGYGLMDGDVNAGKKALIEKMLQPIEATMGISGTAKTDFKDITRQLATALNEKDGGSSDVAISLNKKKPFEVGA